MPVFSYGDPTFFDDLTDETLGYTRAIGLEAGLELGTLLLGVAGTDAPAAMLLQLPPGYRLERHAHGTHRVEILVRGSIELEDGRVLGPGDVSVSGPGELYGPLTAGPDGALSVEIFAATSGLAPVPDDDGSDDARAFLEDIRAKTAAAQAGEPGR